MKATSKASAGHKSSGPKKLKHIIVTPANGGAIAEHHFHEPESHPGTGYMPPPPSEQHILSTQDEMSSHMAKHIPMKAAAKPAGKSAGKSAMEPAEDEADD